MPRSSIGRILAFQPRQVSSILTRGAGVNSVMRVFHAGPFELRWPEEARVKTYDNRPDFHGIIFTDEDSQYEVVVNPLLGLRLLITRTDVLGHVKDIPLHGGTLRFLPEWVEVTPR